MAHRKGPGQRDLAGADLIYDTEFYKSLVFVQYKRLTDDATCPLSTHDQVQLKIILNLCPESDCHSPAGKVPQDHTCIRLGCCPIYYKLLAFAPHIPADNTRMPGRYLQACLLDQSLNLAPSERRSILARGMPHSMFYGLLGRSLIGSRAAAYEKLQDRILEFAENPLVYAQETTIVQPTRSKRSRKEVPR